ERHPLAFSIRRCGEQMQSKDSSQDRPERRQARVPRPSTCRLSNRGELRPFSNSCDRRSTVVQATAGWACRRILSARGFEHEAAFGRIEPELSAVTVSSFWNLRNPLLVRRSGCGINKISAKPALVPQTGWSLTS